MGSLLKWAKNVVTRAPALPRDYPNIKYPTIDPTVLVEEENFGIQRYYPTRISEVFSSRYQVVGKLGFGYSSTVWLARDLQWHHHVALKIFTNDRQNKNEIAIYKHLSKGSKSHIGYRYVRAAIDSFELSSGDSKHECIVHEPLWDSITTMLKRAAQDRLSEEPLRTFLYRLFVDLNYLYTDREIIHTDIKADNIMHYIEDQSILTAFEEEEFVDPTPRKQEGGHDIYVTRHFDHPASYSEAVLCDFGAAVYGNKVNDREAYPQVYRCPEVMLHTTWTYSADIWNGGAMVWDIFAGKHLSNGHDSKRNRYTTRARLQELISVLGPPPLHLLKLGKRSAEFFDKDGKWIEPNEKDPERLPTLLSSNLDDREENLEGEYKVLFINFIRSMLQWEPARELLHDPWLRKGIE